MPYGNSERQKQFQREWYLKHKTEHNRKSKERYWNNLDYEKLRSRIYYLKNKDKKSQYRKEHLEDRRKWYQKNKSELYQKHIKKWRSKGNIPIMDNPFPDDISMHFHHLFPNFCLSIPLPEITHNQYRNEAHYVHCNEWINKIFGLDIENLYNREI